MSRIQILLNAVGSVVAALLGAGMLLVPYSEGSRTVHPHLNLGGWLFLAGLVVLSSLVLFAWFSFLGYMVNRGRHE